MRTSLFTLAVCLACLSASTSLAQDPLIPMTSRTATSDIGTDNLSTGSVFSPMDCVATGDGVANDRAAVFAAIDAAIV